MKKKIWIPLVAVAAAAAATASGLGIHHHNVRALEASLAQAQGIHTRIHAQYETLDRATEESTLTVTENGRPIGVYHLSDLGLEESADTALESAFQAPDLLSEKDFSQLSQEEQLAQLERQDFQPQLGEIPTQACALTRCWRIWMRCPGARLWTARPSSPATASSFGRRFRARS